MELRFNPTLAAGWLTLVLSHPSALHSTKERAQKLLSGLPTREESSPTLEQAVEEALRS
ncbi:MAG: hypothetical protein IT313_04790 [Anaerolineales bacterium]|nr:hypothetical protein [Anaerolineales bacterium]